MPLRFIRPGFVPQCRTTVPACYSGREIENTRMALVLFR